MKGWLKLVQWQRGVRALVVVGSIMAVCRWLGVPAVAAALGAFNALLVDNGGPYRSRLTTMMTAIVAGAAAYVMGAMVPGALWAAVLATMVVCFAITFARVLSQVVASTSVLVLVLYFAGLGGTQHAWRHAMEAAGMVVAGGTWAVAISLVLWPLDPFRPARLAVAGCYASLAEFTAGLGAGVTEQAVHEWQRQQRRRMEAARRALSTTAARAPSRTVRARNLTVLLETSDMLLARTMRLTELAEGTPAEGLTELAGWLARSERAIARALEHRPADDGASFGLEGSERLEYLIRQRGRLAQGGGHLAAEERDSLLELETGFGAVRAIWTGAEEGASGFRQVAEAARMARWDAVRANWTLESAMLRHALRLMLVGGVDVVVMRGIHINHGFWLPMTSIILLQPYGAGTLRRSMQRIVGTIAGGVLAAVLAVAVSDPVAMLVVMTVLAACTLATYAVDYAAYCFFLTPTFVLMSLPHPHDWRYAGVRILTTLAGATIALLAMRLLWAERAEAELSRLLRRGAAADAAYVRAMLGFWKVPKEQRRAAERELLAPARRACGLASNDAEEAVDRVMQEPRLGRRAANELVARDEALTFATYLRRLTQTLTTLAMVGPETVSARRRLERISERLEKIAHGELQRVTEMESPAGGASQEDAGEEKIERMERQVGVLERAAGALAGL